VTTIRLKAVFNPQLEILHRSGQQLLIDREHFLLDGILQIVQITGFVSVHTALQVPPEEEITWWQVRRPWGTWHIAETRNEAPREHVCHHVISSSGKKSHDDKHVPWTCTWMAVCTLTNPVIWTSWRTPSSKKSSRSIDSCWPERWTISSGGLKTAFKRMVVT